MKIIHKSDPFPHTVIENVFTDQEYNDISNEIQFLKDNDLPQRDDPHHAELDNVLSWCMDEIVDEKESAILTHTKKVFHLEYGEPNPLLPVYRLLHAVNDGMTMVHSYTNGAEYFEHRDACILSFLFFVWDEPKRFSGGELVFTDHNYTFDAKPNTCLVFTGVDAHKVNKLVQEDNGYHRNIINMRTWILPS